jgi:hypothetical protein
MEMMMAMLMIRRMVTVGHALRGGVGGEVRWEANRQSKFQIPRNDDISRKLAAYNMCER